MTVFALDRPAATPWKTPADYWPALQSATAELQPPFGVISLAALAHNAYAMLDRSNGTTIRVASKSVRVREVLDAVLALPGYAGVLAYTLPEALWLASPLPELVEGGSGQPITDVVVGYPTADRAAIAQLAADPALASRVTLMVDSVEQLDLIDSVVTPGKRSAIRVCLELDASWNSRLLGHIGTWRSPVHSVADARALAERIVSRPGFTLVGMMAYEGQIAGLADRPAGKPLMGSAVRWIQRQSVRELAERRALAVAAVRDVAELEFVNGGGTGSLETTSAEDAVTEIAAGSGLFGPHLFDNYTRFAPAPAAAFTLPVVRKPAPAKATILGGGWIASGPPASDRLPRPVWPEGLRMVPREMAGEVQTPVTGDAAVRLQVGDRVWWRHTKAGELSEHLNEFALVDDGRVVAMLPTYRGEGKAFA
jgi:D-serine deaminase-like pyridoxal phosphate-dependent protein